MEKKKTSLTYKIIYSLVKAFYKRYTCEGAENIPDEPSIIVGNHCQLHGPLSCELYSPVDRYTWCASQMMHAGEVPSYAFEDFWSQKPRFTKPFYKLLSYLITPLSVCLFNNAYTVPVYHDARILTTFKTTVACLKAGAHVVIFPEHDVKHNNIVYDFQDKFIDVAKLYCRREGKDISFVPLYISPELGKLCYGKPIKYDPAAPAEEERGRICDYLMAEITAIATALPEHTVVPYRNINKKDYPSNKAESASEITKGDIINA